MQISDAFLPTDITISPEKPAKLWMPKRVLFTPDALDEPFGQKILERVKQYNLPVEILKNNRVTGLRGETERETYKLAKSTLAIVNASPSAFRLRPIPPSADFQFHLAEGCPAHCQYCYLAGSLQGPPAIRVFANLPLILNNTQNYKLPNKTTSFEASCYTDPLSIEHLTGSLAETIEFFGKQDNKHLRFVTKFDAVDPLLHLDHNGNSRWRISLNAHSISRRLEGGTASISARIKALRKLALPRCQGGGNYPIGVVLAPIMPIENWQEEYGVLLDELRQHLDFPVNLTFELITHRFTPGSKQVLTEWYPNTSLEMNEENRSKKLNKFGGTKYVYTKDTMKEMKAFFYGEINKKFPEAEILYWT
ncbi:spore photoproduct lyase family protein [Segetibacter sp.]|jgi:spore photoproduct lyase|uniref:spore photoproduct lyase family protein n=1 Tax=Segetibacter sp. TaxID=2231182 RepID=UPI00260FFE27|nr:radical SAM protein [Segetibacter sp.]MCW3082536.1 radical protein [Segetibacter sp.]